MRVCDVCQKPYQATGEIYANLTESTEDADALLDCDLCEEHYNKYVELAKNLKREMGLK